ncbi:MAG: pirin family protein, partial [Anaerolineaceae bacterium]|nr:pirin family protein [Anaerolineaceae bacterium]
MYNQEIINIKPLSFLWDTHDPFLFCANHDDVYPQGNEEQGPAASLAGRNIGQDFSQENSWRMYHGDTVPGFPSHPHRGFETVTIVLNGFVDHSDSYGSTGRYGNGDVQWMTAGSGLQHAEMFPCVFPDKPNPLKLFQVWLNLPRTSKFVEPYYKMLWAEQIPNIQLSDEHGKDTLLTIVAGKYKDISAPSPAPDSWAADPAHHVAIWLIHMSPGATWTLPSVALPVNRTIYFYKGSALTIEGMNVDVNQSIELMP